MKTLFDSSAIFRAIKENQIDCLVDNCTLELARYELGNVLWKNYILQEKVSDQEAKALTKIIKQTLNLMTVIQIECTEEEILETAKKLEITFYDASYVCHAKTEQLALITEDQQLTKKVASYIKASTLDSVVKT